jgi:hypothetical protein
MARSYTRSFVVAKGNVSCTGMMSRDPTISLVNRSALTTMSRHLMKLMMVCLRCDSRFQEVVAG